MKRASLGIAMAFVLIILFLVAVIAFALGSSGIQRLFTSFGAKQTTAALYAAQAGVARALYEVKSNAQVFSTCGMNPLPSYASTLPDDASFNANISCLPGSSSSLIKISSTGVMGSAKQTVNVEAKVYQGWEYPYAFFGIDGFTMNGIGHADSYNSISGKQNTNVANIGTNSSSPGAITLNSGSGTIGIDGNLEDGPGSNNCTDCKKCGCSGLTVSISGKVHDQGVDALQATLDFTDSSDPNFPLGNGDTVVSASPGVSDGSGAVVTTLAPGIYGNITLSNGGSNITLGCGHYSIAGISVSNGAQITVSSSCSESSPVKLYVYNNLSVSGAEPSTCAGSGGLVNIDCGYSFPKDGRAYPSTRLLVYGMPSLTNAYFNWPPSSSLSSLFVGAFYANDTNIYLGGAGYYHGSMVGKTITVSGDNASVNKYGNGDGNLTYDEALANDIQAGPAGSVVVESWYTR